MHTQSRLLLCIVFSYDRTLGGLEARIRLRNYLADQFNKLGKTKTDVWKVDRAMGKLYKEAERVKLVLSANTQCFAQVENLLEDIDFKQLVTRDNLFELLEDYFVPERITRPIIKGTFVYDRKIGDDDPKREGKTILHTRKLLVHLKYYSSSGGFRNDHTRDKRSSFNGCRNTQS